GRPEDLEQLRRSGLGGFLRSRGRDVERDLRLVTAPLFDDPEFEKAVRDLLGPVPDVFRDPDLLKLKVKDLAGDQCLVELQLPVDAEVLAELYRFDVEFVRVEGKWIPAWLAENWGRLMDDARSWVAEALPAERAEDNFGIVFRYLGQLDTMIDFELAVAQGETIPPPTLYDIVDFLRALAEDLELPLPEALRAPDDTVPAELLDEESMQGEPPGSDGERMKLHE
ncbi:MAG: hypothetical protein JSS02_14185, partial [Planctomycetes bacterium]|nr:hypothetical protein [Planctomycetota bacterium]